MAVELEGLEFQIEAKSTNASKGIDALVASFEKLKNAVSQSGLDKLGNLANSLKALNAVKISPAIPKRLTDISAALDSINPESIDRVERLSAALRGMDGIKIPKLSGLNRASDSASHGKKAASGTGAQDVPKGKPGVTDEIIRATNAAQVFKRALSDMKGIFSKSFSIIGKGILKSIQAGLNGLTTAAKKAISAGKQLIHTFGARMAAKVKQTTSGFSKLFASIKRIAMYRLIRFMFSQLTKAIKEGTDNLYQYSLMFDHTFAKSMDRCATSFLYLKNSMGAMAAPLINAIAPALDMIIDKVVALMNIFNQFIARLTGAKTFTAAKKMATSYAESAEDAASATKKAAKEIKDATGSIDELNIISTKDNSGSGGGGTDYGSMFEELPIDNAISDFADKLKQAFESQQWEELGRIVGEHLGSIIEKWDAHSWGTSLGEKINAGLGIAFGFLTSFPFETFGSKIADFFNGILDIVDWNLLGRTFAAKLNALFDFLYGFIVQFDWGKFGTAIAEIFIGFFSEIKWDRIIEVIQAGIEGVKQALVGFLSKIGSELDIEGITTPIIQVVGTIAETLQTFITDTQEWVRGLDLTPLSSAFENLLNAVSPLVETLCSGLSWAYENVLLPFASWTTEEGLPTVINTLAAAFEFLNTVLTVLSPVFEGIWDNVLKPLAGLAWDAISGALEVITNILQKLTDLLKGNTSFSEFIDSLSPGEAMIVGISTALGIAAVAFGIVTAAVTLFNVVTGVCGMFIAALLSPIGLVSIAIGALAAGFVALYHHSEGFRSFIDGIVQGAKELIPGIIEGIESGWNAFIGWLGELWQLIVDGFKFFFGIHSSSTVFAELGGNLIAGLFEGISETWHTITDFFGEVVGGLVTFFEEKWNAIKTYTTETWASIKQTLSETWENVTASAGEKFEAIKEKIGIAWDTVKEKTRSVWDSVKSTLETTWNSVKERAVTSFDSIKETVSRTWEAAKSTTSETWDNIKSTLSTAWDDMKQTAAEKLESIKETISGTWNGIVSSAVNWGRDLCDNLASGIRRGINGVTSAVDSVASRMREYLHFSEPDVGPLSNFHTFMPDMLKLMASGIRDNTYLAENAVYDLTDSISKTLDKSKENFEMPISTKSNIQYIADYGERFSQDTSHSEGFVTSMRDANSEVVNALYAIAGQLVSAIEAVADRPVEVDLDSRRLTSQIEKTQRERGRMIMAGGVIN